MNYVPALSGSTDYFGIYTGPWINWSHGPILGATITLSRRDAGLLISFVALFVSLTGTAFWRISSFVFHHRYSSEAPRDCHYHQRQAILRNSANGPSGLWNLWQTAWSWRGKTPSVYRRMLPILIFTIICLGAFTVAGVLSSKIATSTGAEVLVTSPKLRHTRPGRTPQFRQIQHNLPPLSRSDEQISRELCTEMLHKYFQTRGVPQICSKTTFLVGE